MKSGTLLKKIRIAFYVVPTNSELPLLRVGSFHFATFSRVTIWASLFTSFPQTANFLFSAWDRSTSPPSPG